MRVIFSVFVAATVSTMVLRRTDWFLAAWLHTFIHCAGVAAFTSGLIGLPVVELLELRKPRLGVLFSFLLGAVIGVVGLCVVTLLERSVIPHQPLFPAAVLGGGSGLLAYSLAPRIWPSPARTPEYPGAVVWLGCSAAIAGLGFFYVESVAARYAAPDDRFGFIYAWTGPFLLGAAGGAFWNLYRLIRGWRAKRVSLVWTLCGVFLFMVSLWPVAVLSWRLWR